MLPIPIMADLDTHPEGILQEDLARPHRHQALYINIALALLHVQDHPPIGLIQTAVFTLVICRMKRGGRI